MGNRMKIHLSIILLLIICEFSYSQISNRYTSLWANKNYSNNNNLIDSSGKMQGRFVFRDNQHNDTIQSKYEAFFIDDSLVSVLKYFKNDTIYYGNFSYWKKQYFEKEICLNLIKQKGNWFYIKKSQDTLRCDIFLYSDDFVAPYYSIFPKIPTTVFNYTKQEPTIFSNYTKTKEQKYFYKVINDTSRLDSICVTDESYKNEIKKYYQDGVLKYWKHESFKSFMRKDYHFEIWYYDDGTINKKTIIVQKRRKRPGVGEKWAYYSINKKKESFFNKEGKLMQKNKYKNEKLIKTKNYSP